MKIEDLLDKTCLLGLSYFGSDDELMKQTQHAGIVVNVDEENGISIQFRPETQGDTIATNAEGRVFVIPPHLSPWFKAPEGRYRDGQGKVLIDNPDYFVTWDIHKTQNEKEGDHEWWEWVPRTVPPKVN